MHWIFAAVQALTEFLPVSSSGHLAIIQHIFPGLSDQQLAFNVLLHAGTLCSTIVYFRKDIVLIIKKSFSGDLKLASLLVVGSVPAAVFGLTLKDKIEQSFGSLVVVGCCLIFTSILLELARRKTEGSKILPSVGQAFLIGCFQALALLPGVSRSGSTICAALFVGLKPSEAFKFSFLLSLPAIGGATLLEAKAISALTEESFFDMASSFVVAFVLGYLALVLLNRFVQERRFIPFSLYTLCLGVGLNVF